VLLSKIEFYVYTIISHFFIIALIIGEDHYEKITRSIQEVWVMSYETTTKLGWVIFIM